MYSPQRIICFSFLHIFHEANELADSLERDGAPLTTLNKYHGFNFVLLYLELFSKKNNSL